MARSFNGTTDLIAANTAASFAFTPYSVAFWVNAPITATERCVFGEGLSSSANSFLELFAQPGSIKPLGYRVRNTTGFALSGATAGNVIDSTPHHFAFTQDGSGNWAVFVDGGADNSGTYSTVTVISALNRCTIGALVRSTTSFFCNGKVWDVAKWSRKLSAGEAALLGAGLPASHLAPDRYWPLFGADSPEPDLGVIAHVAGTLTGTAAANGARVGIGLVGFT